MGKHIKFLEKKREFWLQHMKSWRQSGLMQSEYCRRHSLSDKSFVYWKKRLGFLAHSRSPGQSRASSSIKDSISEGTVIPGKEIVAAGVTFVPISASHFSKTEMPAVESGEISVFVGNRFRVDILKNYSAVLLAEVIRTLEKLA